MGGARAPVGELCRHGCSDYQQGRPSSASSEEAQTEAVKTVLNIPRLGRKFPNMGMKEPQDSSLADAIFTESSSECWACCSRSQIGASCVAGATRERGRCS